MGVDGIVFALMMGEALGLTSPGDVFREFRVLFAVCCFAFALYHLGELTLSREDERVMESGQIWAAGV